MCVDRDFPGGPVVKTLHFQCRDAGDAGLIPGWGIKSHAAWPKKIYIYICLCVCVCVCVCV